MPSINLGHSDISWPNHFFSRLQVVPQSWHGAACETTYGNHLNEIPMAGDQRLSQKLEANISGTSQGQSLFSAQILSLPKFGMNNYYVIYDSIMWIIRPGVPSKRTTAFRNSERQLCVRTVEVETLPMGRSPTLAILRFFDFWEMRGNGETWMTWHFGNAQDVWILWLYLVVPLGNHFKNFHQKIRKTWSLLLQTIRKFNQFRLDDIRCINMQHTCVYLCMPQLEKKNSWYLFSVPVPSWQDLWVLLLPSWQRYEEVPFCSVDCNGGKQLTWPSSKAAEAEKRFQWWIGIKIGFISKK